MRQKELLKRLRAEVDVLTLTATPIPRTLAMSLEGIRDFSVIATAPQRRLAIKTFVASYSPGIVREAALRELKRGGQIYFLHNEVDTIATRAETLAKLLPEARIAVAHGQMAERELEHVMRDFYQQRINLLLCSTIIETGIDVPTANTIIIDRADRFGLAQLHQLRGRVGRSHHQAYAYLLTPPADALSAQAKKRLEAIQMMEDLGSGFYLAMHDLEIRGAGEVLGESQSGEMQEVGFQLYNDMLRASVSALKSGREPDLGRAARRHHRDQPARAGAAAGALLRRRARAARAVQAARERRNPRRTRRHPGRTGRPLRPHARPGAGAARCHRLRLLAKPLGVTQDRRRPGAHDDPVRQAAAVRRRRADPARAEGRPDPLRRTGSRAHRARRAGAVRAHRTREGIPGQTGVSAMRSGAIPTGLIPSARRFLAPPGIRP